jgi:hypothetical protein
MKEQLRMTQKRTEPAYVWRAGSQDRRNPAHKSDAVLLELTWTKEFLWYSAISYVNNGSHADTSSKYRFKPIHNVSPTIAVHEWFGILRNLSGFKLHLRQNIKLSVLQTKQIKNSQA